MADLGMEADYSEYKHRCMLTNTEILIKKDQATTYIHMYGPKQSFEVYGSLVYSAKCKGNNQVIS
jgi:hypothetical protein